MTFRINEDNPYIGAMYFRIPEGPGDMLEVETINQIEALSQRMERHHGETMQTLNAILAQLGMPWYTRLWTWFMQLFT